MPKLLIDNTKKSFEAEEGQTLMKALLEKQVPVASSCGGEGVCGKCRIQVLEGIENLSSKTELELSLQKKYHLKENERISCQSRICGDLKLRTTYW